MFIVIYKLCNLPLTLRHYASILDKRRWTNGKTTSMYEHKYIGPKSTFF